MAAFVGVWSFMFSFMIIMGVLGLVVEMKAKKGDSNEK